MTLDRRRGMPIRPEAARVKVAAERLILACLLNRLAEDHAMFRDLVILLGVLTLALLSPGPDFLLVVKNTVGGSRARALGTVSGIATGLALLTTVVSLGFVALSSQHLRTVQLVGAVWLGWIGIRALLSPRAAEADTPTTPASTRDARSGFIEGLVCNVTNAKAFVFFVSLFAQFIRPDRSAAWRLLLPVVIVVHGLTCWTLIVLALQSPPAARRLGRAQRWLPRVFGGALVLVAALMLVETLR